MTREPFQYDHLAAYVVEHPWAVTGGMLATIANIVARRLAGEPTDPDAVAAALVARSNREVAVQGPSSSGGVAVIPVFGVIAPRMNMLSDVSGGTTFEALTTQLRDAVSNPRVTRVVFDVDSPGGNVAGASEFAREVRQAAAKKPVVAVAAHTMASASYWAMSGASEIVASPSAMAGSIGVFSIHDDLSAALEQLGVKRTVISSGKYKAEAIEGPLSLEAKAHLQQLVSTAFGRFVADVGTGRHVSAAAVRDGYGQGRLLDAESARSAGLVDRIATLDEVLAQDGRTAPASLEPHRAALAHAAMTARRHELDAVARSRRLH